MSTTTPKRQNRPATVTPDLHTVPETGVIIAASTRTVWRLISRGLLKTVHVGRGVRVTRASIDEFIQNGGVR